MSKIDNSQEVQNEESSKNSFYEQMMSHREKNMQSEEEAQVQTKEEKLPSKKGRKIITELKNEDKQPEDQHVHEDDDVTVSTAADNIQEDAKNKQSSDAEREYAALEQRLQDTKKWGQQKSKALINAKRKVNEILSTLKADGSIVDTDAEAILNSFQNSDDSEEEPAQSVNPFVAVKDRMDKEFKVYKRYNKGADLEDKYNAFYHFFPLLSPEAQEEAFNYLQEEEPDVAIDYIIDQGTDLHNALYNGAKEKGSVVSYVKYLQQEIKKLKDSNKELTNELDLTVGKVRNRVSDSNIQPRSVSHNNVKDFYAKRYQS